MFTFEGIDYKSKSVVARDMLAAGKGRMEISKILNISYQTVHSIMRKSGIKPAPRVKKESITKKNTKYPVCPGVDKVATDIVNISTTV